MRIWTAVVLTLAVAGGGVSAEEVPREEIRRAISGAVESILSLQNDDGSFSLRPGTANEEYPIGNTSLAVMSLEYARPHLTGDLRVRTFEAIRKGVSSIMQQKPEEKTYSAGLTICALFMENPSRFRRQIAAYATMLVISQHEKDYVSGEWGYNLRPLPPSLKDPHGAIESWGDKSNTQFALLGLYHAARAGYQVPRVIWERSADHYRRAQFDDGGWGYMPSLRPKPYANMTIASTISLNLCEEMLRPKYLRGQCEPPPPSKEIEAGLKWIGDNWESKRIGSDTYGLYALERLGIIMGRANIGGHDWYNEGARTLLGSRSWRSFAGTSGVSTAFGLMFLARGLEPIVINKLERRGTNDWNNAPYDVKHLVEHIRDNYQQPIQWRIVTLEAPLELLLRTPILYISGRYALDFNEDEKQKLKDYVAGGGTIFGQACSGKREFNRSFHKLVKELFGSKLRAIPRTHGIYGRMKTRRHAPKPLVKVVVLDEEQGRPAVIYLPHDHCCRWHIGGRGSDEAFAVGKGIYFYVTFHNKIMSRNRGSKPKPTPTPKKTTDDFGEATDF